jgi:RNA polymerase sigma-70 factor (ECF subfamily)
MHMLQAEPQLDDRAVLAEIASGQLDAFDVFVDRYKDRLYRYLRSQVSDAHAAEDLAQEVFLRVFRAAKLGHQATAVSAAPWLFTIARNCATDYLRLRYRRPPEAELDYPVEDDGFGDPVDQLVRSEQAKLAYETTTVRLEVE